MRTRIFNRAIGTPSYPVKFFPLGFATPEDLGKFVTVETNNTNKIFAAVEFHDTGLESGNFNYSLRPTSVPRSEVFEKIKGYKGWITNILWPARANLKKDPFWARGSDPAKGGKPHYYQEGFVQAQHFLDLNFIKLLGEKRNTTVDIEGAEFRFQRFPHPKFLNDDFISAIEQQLPFVIMLCFLYFGQQAAKGTVVLKHFEFINFN